MSVFQLGFPNLNSGNHRITSPTTSDYNCIAWAAGEDDRWWWPVPVGIGYWPSAAPRAETVDAFVVAFATIGYTVCDSGVLEVNFDKAAIFVNDQNVPTHMARQLEDGTWTSKLGPNVDLNHFTLNALDGPAYGHVSTFLRRANLL